MKVHLKFLISHGCIQRLFSLHIKIPSARLLDNTAVTTINAEVERENSIYEIRGFTRKGVSLYKKKSHYIKIQGICNFFENGNIVFGFAMKQG